MLVGGEGKGREEEEAKGRHLAKDPRQYWEVDVSRRIFVSQFLFSNRLFVEMYYPLNVL